jgi:hypothetical protein
LTAYIRVQLLQVGSLTLSTASPELVQQAVAQSWSQVCVYMCVYVCMCTFMYVHTHTHKHALWNSTFIMQIHTQAVEPSSKSLNAQAAAMLAEMRADERLKQQVAAVKQVEAKYDKPQPKESLEQLLRPPPPGQQPTMLLQVGTGDGISSLGVGVEGFRHFEAAGRGRGDDYYQAKFRYGGEKIQQQLAVMHQDSELAAAQQAETTEETSLKARGQRALEHVHDKLVDTLGAAAGKSTTLLSSARSNVDSRKRQRDSSKRQSLLEPNVYPQVGYPFEQTVEILKRQRPIQLRILIGDTTDF